MEDFYTRVKALAKANKITIENVATSAGIALSSYNTNRMHDNLPRADVAVKIADTLHTTVHYLVSGEGESPDEKKKFFVPILNQKLSAGFGQQLPESQETIGYMEVPPYLRHYGENLAVLFVDGDSMEPTLRRGDLVLCDSCGYDGEGLYAIQKDGNSYVKRVYTDSGKYIIKSDNPLYPLMEEPIGSEAIAIIGRVHYKIIRCD